MSQESVEIVRRSVEAWNRRDLRRFLAYYRSDAEVDWSRSRSPFKGVYRGHGEIESFCDVFWSAWDDVQLEAHYFKQAGPDVVLSRAEDASRAPAMLSPDPSISSGIGAWRRPWRRGESGLAPGLTARADVRAVLERLGRFHVPAAHAVLDPLDHGFEDLHPGVAL